jgi:tryptophan synthase alpha chain
VSRIRELFSEAKARGESLFIPYLTMGDPNLEASIRLVETLARSGAGVIELGVPYSDPVADGPTNMKAADRALRAGTTLRGVLDASAKLRASGVKTPFVLFTYYNPVFKMGHRAFAEEASRAGIDAVLTVDLPPEEAGELISELSRKKIGTVFLASPTTPPERLKEIERASSEFLYYVSRLGVTGAKAALSASLGEEISRLRKQVKIPVAVGFGISDAEQASQVASLADAVVVGSAIVKRIEENPDPARACAVIEKFVKELVLAARRKSSC